jgi:hypothetical protein
MINHHFPELTTIFPRGLEAIEAMQMLPRLPERPAVAPRVAPRPVPSVPEVGDRDAEATRPGDCWDMRVSMKFGDPKMVSL